MLWRNLDARSLQKGPGERLQLAAGHSGLNRQWIREFYQQNKLVKGEIELRGRRVDLSHITCPLLSIAGKKDHICTLPQAEAIMHLAGSKDKEFYVLDAGHVGLLTGADAKKGLWPKVESWLDERSK
jgi:poly[(R)-3-hydroxyalkanoate] polymerase subunit PhaC